MNVAKCHIIENINLHIDLTLSEIKIKTMKVDKYSFITRHTIASAIFLYIRAMFDLNETKYFDICF